MFDLRMRRFAPDGTRSVVLKTSDLVVTVQESGTARLKFSVSERVAGRLAAPFLVGVEFSVGGAYQQPRNGLFVVTEEGSDTADVSGTVEFTGVPFVPWLLEGMHQRMHTYTGARYLGDKTEWPNATPGRILRSLIDHGKSVDGWAPMLTTDFTATADSAGAAWTAAERWSPEFQKLTSIADVFEAHVNAGLIDWWTEGTALRVFRPGSGTVYPNVKLGGPGFQRMPARRQYEGQFNFLTIIAEDGPGYFENPGADRTFGTRHMTATFSGVKLADAARIVAPMLVEGRTPKRELSYEWTPAAGLPVPWVDFQVGDGVQVRDRDGWVEQRVLGITVSKSDAVTVRATVGSKLLNRLKRAVSKIEGGSLGQITGGTGVTLPVQPPVQSSRPATPSGLRVASNTAVWLDDGSALTSVMFAWNEVTATADGALLDGATYELWGRAGSATAARLSATDALQFLVQGWEPGTPRFVKVRALDREGRAGAFSGEIAVTPVTPASIVPKAVTGVTVASNTGSFKADGSALASVKLTWTPVTMSTDDTPVTVVEYEVMVGQSAMRATGPQAVITVPSGSTVPVTVRARTSLNVWGDPSVSANVTGALPAVVAYTPTAPALTAGMGAVAFRWAGTPAVPAGFGWVAVDTASAAAGPWYAYGTTLSAAGGGSVVAAVGSTVHVRFRAFDTLGRLMGTSAAASAVAAGVPVSGLPQEIIDQIDVAMQTADGKNRVIPSIAQPPASPLVQIGDQWLQISADGASIVAIKTWDGAGWNERPLWASSVIASESITAPLLKAGEIEVNHVSPSFGDNLVLSARESVSIIVGETQEVIDAAAAAADAKTAAGTAQSAAAAADAKATGAQSTATTAKNAATTVSNRLDAHQLYFKVDGDAAKIGRPDGKAELVLAPEGIELKQNAVTVSSWIGGVFIADEVQLKKSATIGNHQFMAYGNGRTIVRPL